MRKPTDDHLAKKNAFILIVKNLNRLKPKEALEAEIRIDMGDKNILNIFFKNHTQAKLTGWCNIQCLSAATYKKFVKKTIKYAINLKSSLLTPRVRMGYPNPLPRNLQGWVSTMLPQL
jgi:hypothetical protein